MTMPLTPGTLLILVGLLGATLRISTPLLFAALGGMFSERSGVMNIGLEGIMLVGAFVAVVGSYFSGSPWLGVLLGAVAGGALALIHAWLCVDQRANQIVSGTAINMLGTGATSFLVGPIFGQQGVSKLVNEIQPIRVPGLAGLPVIGKFFLSLDPIVLSGLLLVPVAYLFLFRTPWGLRIRSAGELPKASETAGIDVRKTRYVCVVISGLLAGIGGAYLSVGELGVFVITMTEGRGFIALAAMIFGKWQPFGLLGACLLFGFADTLQSLLQAHGVPVPPQFLLMLPYVLTLVALTSVVGRAVAPASVGKPLEE